MFRVISFNTCMLKAIIFFSLFMSFFIIVFMYILVFLVIMWMMEEDILFSDMFYCFIFIMGFMFMVILNIICKKEWNINEVTRIIKEERKNRNLINK